MSDDLTELNDTEMNYICYLEMNSDDASNNSDEDFAL